MSRWTITGGRVAFALLGVAGTTFACSEIAGVNATTVGFAYLLLVLAIAAFWGLTEAVVASVAAMLCYNYFFLPPIGRFTIAEPANWIALFAFLVTALVASHLSNRAKQQTIEAKNRQLETEQLYALSRAILLSDASQPIGSRAAEQISQIFGANGVVLFDAQTGNSFQGGGLDLHGLEDSLKQAVRQGTHCHKDHGVDIWPISLGGHSVGALAVQGLKASDGAVQALLNLVAIAIERVRTENATNRAEAARQSEEFKSTLLDAVAHEFKTPLTSIKAASTALLAEGQHFAPEAKDLLAVIDEEADRLNSLVTEAVRMSQIDAGKVRLERTAVSVETLLDPAIASFGNRADGRIKWIEGAAGPIYVDREMILLALRQLIDNALKYASPATPIRVWADRHDDRVLIHVADEGPGIPEGDRERVFEKFFRRQKAGDKVPGSGLGLHIAREIARMHGGGLWVQVADSGGSEFCLALPRFTGVGT
jgi:two-component system, OmpR family, sensor histidine kinase KdpD